MKASILPCVLSFASQNWILFPKHPEPRLRMLHQSTGQCPHPEILSGSSPNPRSKFPWSPAPLLLEGPIRSAAVPQGLLSPSLPSLYLPPPPSLLSSSCFPVSGCLLLSCPLCVLCHWCLSWRQGLGLGAWRGGGGCAGSGQTRGPGHERNFPSFSSRPLWLGSSTEGGMSQRAAEQGGSGWGWGCQGSPGPESSLGHPALSTLEDTGSKGSLSPPKAHWVCCTSRSSGQQCVGLAGPSTSPFPQIPVGRGLLNPLWETSGTFRAVQL